MKEKQYVTPERAMSSLINLRDELMEKCATNGASPNLLEIYYKLNSCLYSDYPTQPQLTKRIVDTEFQTVYNLIH